MREAKATTILGGMTVVFVAAFCGVMLSTLAAGVWNQDAPEILTRPGYAYGATLTLSTSAQELYPVSEGRGFTYFECCSDDAISVTVGGPGVTAGAGQVICATCSKACVDGTDLRETWAVAASGTPTLGCLWRMTSPP